VFAVRFIAMDQPLAVSDNFIELLSKLAAGRTLLGDDASN
jgi:hypothetical protein